MKAGESVATRTLTDGTKLQVRLSQPDALVLNIEVPRFEQTPFIGPTRTAGAGLA